MEKYIIVKREECNEYLIDEAIPECDIIYRKHNEYKFGKQVIIPSEPDSVYVSVECKYNEDFDLFVLYIMSLDVFIREYMDSMMIVELSGEASTIISAMEKYFDIRNKISTLVK